MLEKKEETFKNDNLILSYEAQVDESSTISLYR